jgi:cytochrome c biogenesis protein CcmG, thiol:disulfide interchange protein DsbE
MRRMLLWLPLGVFLLFVAVVAAGLLSPPDRTIRSRLVGQPLPEFELPQGQPAKPGLSSADFATGRPRILNIFASWCIPCMAEAPQLDAIARRGIPIDAIAIRDKPDDIAKFLQKYGDPFQRIGLDIDSRVQMALGSSGIPETFVIDGRGIIRHQHIGVISDGDVTEIVAAYEAAR